MGEKADNKKNVEDLQAADDHVIQKTNSELLNIVWARIILDEAHQIRNHKSLTSQAVCLLRAERRWCVTGTPIQNKELDLYSLLRFLRCYPFDEYQVWKKWIENNSVQGQERMNTLVRTLLLRRTKEQTSNITGKKLVELPAKYSEEHRIILGKEEKKVYDKVFGFSQTALQNYMEKARIRKTEKQGTNGGSSIDDLGQGDMASHSEVKAHHLLVLLLILLPPRSYQEHVGPGYKTIRGY